MNFPKGKPNLTITFATVKMAKQWENNTKPPRKCGNSKS